MLAMTRCRERQSRAKKRENGRTSDYAIEMRCSFLEGSPEKIGQEHRPYQDLKIKEKKGLGGILGAFTMLHSRTRRGGLG